MKNMTIRNGIIMDKQTFERAMQGSSVRQKHLLTALSVVTFILMLLVSWGVQAVDLESVDYQATSSSKSRLILNFSGTAPEPNTFSMDDPARIVLDFVGVKNKLDDKNQQINVGLTRSIATVEAGERTRMVINMARPVPYTVDVSGNTVIVMLETGSATASTSTAPSRAAATGRSVTDIDFRRGEMGEARVLIHLSDDGAAVDIRRQRDNEVVVDLVGVSLPEKLQRRLDVIDFATPVHFIQSTAEGNNTRMLLTTSGDFEHLAYQSDKLLVVEVKPVVETDTDGVAMPGMGSDQGYTGEKLSLNFQNIEVRAVLQLLADFTGMNLVTSDTVQGNLTLRLRNVPWDQALDIILKTKGLDKRINGNVMLVAPAAEIAAREKQELEARRQLVELEPLFSDFIEINFAKASEIAGILRSDSQQAGASSSRMGFLSERGSVTVDERTNSLLIRDTSAQLSDIRRLIERLDIPVRQVLIESRIVIANNDFTRELGVRFGGSARSRTLGAGTDGRLSGMQVDGGNRNLINPSRGAGSQLGQTGNLNVNLPVTNPAGTVALALAKLPLGMILELELSAMQEEGKGEIISSPRVITSNQKQATIEQGTEIPYQEASSSGATSVSFKEATLKLDVTPQITPDDRIVMDLEVNKDEVGEIFLGVPSIDTRSVKTQVLVDNGETVVLGGIYEQISTTNSQRVPFFGDLPYVGFMFRNNLNEDRRRELLVFVTPKIIKEGMDF
ncbi:MAG: type IV pilus secretin PilQ [Methylophaga sp.]|nr:type IV pilus secretin PilQ [Methylophaga sp.]